MAENEFSVVYTGRIAEGENLDNVKKRLSRLFKKPEPVIDRLLKPNGSVIKKGIDKKTAEKYLKAIEKTGALCKIEPGEPEHDETPPAEPERRAEPRVVVIPLMKKGDERFSPRQAAGISGRDKAIIIKADEDRAVAYSGIKAIAAFERAESNEDAINFLFYTSSDARPFICAIESISYDNFPVKIFEKSLASFRGFLHFLCSKNPSVILEETTFDFLSGSSPQKLDEKTILKLSTGLGQLIESGDAESHT
ncbi:MAG: hypothetical protein GXP53_00920 [Deltaproteobacteria bacterium]|nr:hypothetical protein [Deltaproteobacteria bacterium]